MRDLGRCREVVDNDGIGGWFWWGFVVQRHVEALGRQIARALRLPKHCLLEESVLSCTPVSQPACFRLVLQCVTVLLSHSDFDAIDDWVKSE